MKTRLLRSALRMKLQNCARRTWCSGVSRSVATNEFFSREPEPSERALHARAARRCPRTSHQDLRQFSDGRVGHLMHDCDEELGKLAVDRRHVSAASRARFERARLAVQSKDPIHRCGADAEQRRSFLVRPALGSSANTASRNFSGMITSSRDHACGIASTGRGASVVEYKSLWQYADSIHFGSKVPDFTETLRNVCRRGGMYLQHPSYECIVAFVRGYNFATDGGPLVGFREWLIPKLGYGNNLDWDTLALHLAFPESEAPLAEANADSAKMTHATSTLCQLYETFEAERAKPDGLRRILLAYESWLREQEWYGPESPHWVALQPGKAQRKGRR